MDNGRLLLATMVSFLRREKRKKSSDNAATDGDAGASVLRGDVVWLDNVKDDGQRETTVGNSRQSPKESKVKKIE